MLYFVSVYSISVFKILVDVALQKETSVLKCIVYVPILLLMFISFTFFKVSVKLPFTRFRCDKDLLLLDF